MGEHYPLFPGHVKGSDTSKAAAESVSEVSGSIRARVLSFVRGRERGVTDDEIEICLRLRHQTASARRRELVLLGLVRDSGDRRKTTSGRSATVWVSNDASP